MEKNKIIPIAVGTIIFILILLTYFISLKDYYSLQETLIKHSILGPIFYILFCMFSSIVITPVSSLPLVLLASKLFGWLPSIFYTMVGWSLGSLTAFFLAKKFGRPLVEKMISLKKIDEVEDMIPKTNLFFSLVFLRFVVPGDILSYVLGLFTHISYGIFISTTLVGTLPFLIVFSYFGKLPVLYHAIAFLLAGILGLIGMIISAIKLKENRKKTKT